MAVLAGCREYQDDIVDLWEQVDLNTSTIAANTLAIQALQTAFEQGVVVYSIEPDGEGGVTIQTSSGSSFFLKGAKGETPSYRITGEGHLLAEVGGNTVTDCGQVVAAVPDVRCTIDSNGHLLLNGLDLGQVVGRNGAAAALSFRLEQGELFVELNGTSTSLGTVKGPQGDDGVSAVLPDLSFSMENDSLLIRFGNEVIKGGQLAADFEIRDGAYWYNNEKLGDIQLSRVDFEAVGGSLFVAGRDTGIKLRQQIFMVQNQDEVLLNLPLQDGTYQTVSLPKVLKMNQTDLKVLHHIQSLEFVPGHADGTVLQGVVLDFSGNILDHGALDVTFKVTPAAAAGTLAKLFATHPASFSLHQHNFPVRSYVGELPIAAIKDVDASAGLFTVQSSSLLEGNPDAEALSVYLAVNYVNDTCNLDIASQYVPVERSVIRLSELELRQENPGMSLEHDLCYDEPEAFFNILESDYDVYVNVNGSMQPLSDYGYSYSLVFSMNSHLLMTSTEGGFKVSLAGNVHYGDSYSLAVGADIDGDGIPDVFLPSSHQVHVTRCNTFNMSFVEPTLTWSSSVQTLECLDDPALAGLPGFFLLDDMDALKAALADGSISLVFNSSNLELIQDPSGCLKVQLAANTLPQASGYPYVATFSLKNSEEWRAVVTVRLTVQAPENTTLQKVPSYWTGANQETLLPGTSELRQTAGGFTVTLNDAFQTGLLNPGCCIKAALSAPAAGVTLNEVDGVFSLFFSETYAMAPVAVDFSVCSASDATLVFSTLTASVQLPSPLCSFSMSDGELAASTGTLSLATLAALHDWSGALLWSGASGLPAGGVLTSVPPIQFTLYVDEDIFPDLVFNVGATSVLESGIYVVSGCTTVALAPSWSETGACDIEVVPEKTFPWLQAEMPKAHLYIPAEAEWL